MKIIDLLNKIANDELEDGFKFKWKQYIITYKKTKDGVLADSLTLINASFIADLRFKLDDEIEIIEEQEYEEIAPASGWIFCESDFNAKKTTEMFNALSQDFSKKINKLIESVNKINKYIADKESNNGR